MFLFESSVEKKARQDVEKNLETCLRSAQDRNVEKYQRAMEGISKHVQSNNQKAIEQVVDTIKTTIKDDQFQPIRKYQAIKLLRDLMKIQIKNKNKNLGKYVVKKILKRLVILAGHKPYSNDQQRGRDLFKNAKKGQQKYSVMFLNELLLAIEQWSKTWPGVSEGTRKQFHSAYKQLITNGVQFPKQTIKSLPPQNYRDDNNRNSTSPYNSVLPKRQTSQKVQYNTPPPKRQQPRTSNIKQSKKPKVQGINQKQIKQHFKKIVDLLTVFTQTLEECSQMSADQWELVKMIIQELPQLISKGDEFVIQVPPEQMEGDLYIKKIQQSFKFEQSVSKDMKKADKNINQFPAFKKKYIRMSNTLKQELNKEIRPRNSFQRPQLQVQINSRPSRLNNNELQTPPTQSAIKRLSVPKVKGENLYNSSSAQQNNWVIRQKQQFNSNSQKNQEPNQKHFGSFGIGGIGNKTKQKKSQNSQNEDQNRQSHGRPSIENNDNVASKNHKQKHRNDQQQSQVQKSNIKEKQFQKGVSDKVREPENNQFGGFQLSGQNKTDKKHQQFYFDEPQSKYQKQAKNKQESTDELFKAKEFQKQQRVINPNDQSKNGSEQSSQGGFFGNFGEGEQKQANQLPTVQRTRRKQKTINADGKNKAQNSVQNPFDNQMNSQTGQESNNFSAFQKDKSSVVEDSKVPNPFGTESEIDKSVKNARKDSFQLNPFETVNRTEQDEGGSNNNDQVPNFYERKVTNPFSDNASVLSKKSKVINPFQDKDASQVSNNKSKNPFDENKSQNSYQSRSQVNQFNMNQSMTKSQKSNPFETTSQNNKKAKNASKNPFNDSKSLSRRSNAQNPFETSNFQFKPQTSKNFDSVSQQASFKKIQKKIVQKGSIQIDPFQAGKRSTQQVPEREDNVRESWNLEVKSHKSNDGFEFDQFQDIGGNNRRSNTQDKGDDSKNPFQNSTQQNNSVDRKQQKPQNSIRFSQFGQAQAEVNRSTDGMRKRQQTQKSFNFSDFQNVGNNIQKVEQAHEFSGFDNMMQSDNNKPKIQRQQFSAFEVTKSDMKGQMKSQHSGFSGFNVKIDDKSDDGRAVDKKNSDQSDRELFNINTDRTQNEEYTKRNNQKSNLQQNNTDSKYRSPEFNNPAKGYESKRGEQEQRSQQPDYGQKSLSIKFQEFTPIEKKGYAWNPLGVIQSETIYNIEDTDVQNKRQQLLYYKSIYDKEQQLMRESRQTYNRARKQYIEKISKLDQTLKQLQSYKNILGALKESNNDKQQEIFSLNAKIRKMNEMKERILEKEKLLFEKTKAINQQQAKYSKNQYRSVTNKRQLFNRNLKMMREKDTQAQANKGVYSRIAYSSYNRA